MLAVTDCSKPLTVSGNYLLTDISKSVNILTDDHRIVKLKSGDYKVIDYKDSAVVYGRGIWMVQGTSIEKEFNGSINLLDITEVEFYSEASAWISAPVAGLALAFLVIMIYLLAHKFST